MPYSPSIGSANLPGGLNPPVIGSVGGQTANQTVLRTIYEYDPFSFIQTVYQRHADFPSFRTMLRTLSPGRKVSAPTTGHYEQDWINSLVKIKSVITATAGAGTTVVLELDDSMMYNAGAKVSGSAAKASFPRVNQIIQFKDGKRGIIVSKNTGTDPHRISVRPLNAAQEITSAGGSPTVTAGESYAILDNAWGEGTGLPEGITPRVIKYTNYFQIIKEAGAITGTEMTNMTFPQWQAGADGSLWVPIQMDMMKRFERAVCHALLFGTTINNITAANSIVGNDTETLGTEGLLTFAEAEGHVDTYTVGAYDITDFDALATIFEQERIGERQVLTFDGFTIFQETENALQNLLNANLSVELMKQLSADQGVPTDAMQPFSNEDFSFYIGFRALKKSGYTFFFRLLHEFNEYMGVGAPGYDYPSYRVVTPLGYTKNRSTGESVRYIGYEYKGLGGYSRENVLSQFAGAGVAGVGGVMDTVSDQYDVYRAGLVCEIAGHWACANKIVIQKPA